MKLIVPYAGEVHPLDARLIRLAEFVGITCETAPVGVPALVDRRACCVVNPVVLEQALAGSSPCDLFSGLRSRFSHLLVHGLRSGAFDDNLVSVLSAGRLQSIQPIDGVDEYRIAKECRDICGPFSGLAFGPTNASNDRVFAVAGSDSGMQAPITIGVRPFMVALDQQESRIFFLAGADIADLDAEADDDLSGVFSQFVPHAMALRNVFGSECWHSAAAYASVIIDDPLLRRNYGFLNFETLLQLMKQHHFHSTIAFIPHNFRRSSPRITRMFHENTGHFALCFHGNDHTGAEFASTDTIRLNTMLEIAEQRMKVHQELTGLRCDRVMVFPQGQFSAEAMKVLQARNFHAAVNTVLHPRGRPTRLSIGELARPAVLRYEGFPLFLRKSSRNTRSFDIAFNLFFGRPILIVEHHDLFEHPAPLAEAVIRINSIAPGIRWASVGTTVTNSVLVRRTPDGTDHIRPYAATVQVSNATNSDGRARIEWTGTAPSAQVHADGMGDLGCDVLDGRIRVSTDLVPGESRTFSVVYRNELRAFRDLGLKWNARAFVRRRLSEIRDNHLSKSPRILSLANNLRRVFQ